MKAVVTVSGIDRKGVIARVSSFLSDRNINILDISQTIMGDRFAMIMLVDMDGCTENLADLSSAAEQMGRDIGMSVRIQHEDLFEEMHRV